MKNIILFSIIGLAVIGLGIGLYFGFVYIPQEVNSYVSVSINPAVEFTLNSKNQVITAVATDAEGDEIIQSYNFYGMDINDACEKFTELCYLAGYIDIEADETEGENNVIITVVNENTTTENNIRQTIRNKIENFFVNNGIFGQISEDTLTQYLDLANEYDLSVGHIKLIMKALDYNPDLTFDELKDLPIRDIVQLTKEEHNEIKQTVSSIRTQLKEDLEALKTSEEYADMFNLIYDIKDLRAQLNDTEGLTTEQITVLETTLNEYETTFEEEYADLFEEYKDDRKELMEQAKIDSTELIEEIKETFDNKKEEYSESIEANQERIRNAGNEIKNRIRDWLENR